MHNLIKNLKEENQDYEFYPTTSEILRKVSSDIKYHYYRCSSVLDIGAGNGKSLLAFRTDADLKDLYAIEKSEILRKSLDADIFTIGTEFYEQSLIDKQIDITFCNPPYSQYEAWSSKIIRESASKVAYLIIPSRWKESEEIKKAIEYRSAETVVLGEFSFEKSEDRTARAIVNIVKIEFKGYEDDAFERFFNAEFSELIGKFSDENEGEEKPKKENRFSELVSGKDYVSSLVALYKKELEHIKKNYDLVGKLDPDLMREFEVTPKKVKECLRARLKGLKNLYWQELISRMSEVTNRLISKKRRSLLDTINKNANVDFTEQNIYAVIIWILKNATQYIDDQLIETYEKALSQANVVNYKSNQRVFKCDRWRYNEEKPSHIFLEYRLVLQGCGRIEKDWTGKKNNLSEYACEVIADFLTVAYNLGFKCNTGDFRLDHWNKDVWSPGRSQVFECDQNGKVETLLEVKAHYNGNIHIRMNQKFALALNVEYGRLKGWIKSGEEAAEELGSPEAKWHFKEKENKINSIFLLKNC